MIDQRVMGGGNDGAGFDIPNDEPAWDHMQYLAPRPEYFTPERESTAMEEVALICQLIEERGRSPELSGVISRRIQQLDAIIENHDHRLAVQRQCIHQLTFNCGLILAFAILNIITHGGLVATMFYAAFVILMTLRNWRLIAIYNAHRLI